MGGEAVDTGTRWTGTDPQVVARHAALVTQLRTLRRDQEEQERGEPTIATCLKIARLPPGRRGRDVRPSVDAGDRVDRSRRGGGAPDRRVVIPEA
jgi:hypothetical protein